LAAHAALLKADCGVVRKLVIDYMSPVPNAFRIVHSCDRSGRERSDVSTTAFGMAG
jgi:hypothetical protein